MSAGKIRLAGVTLPPWWAGALGTMPGGRTGLQFSLQPMAPFVPLNPAK